MHEEIGLTAGHVDLPHDQPTWVVHAGYRHAVFIATLSEASRARTDWGLGAAATPELDEYRGDFVDFANFFANDMHGDEMVHCRIKTREVFDLACSAYLADSDDEADDDGTPPSPPQPQPASEATSSEHTPGHGVGGPGAGPDVPSPVPGPPPDAAASTADAAAMPASAPARVPRAVAEREQTDSALTSYHSGNALSTTPATPPPRRRGNLHAPMGREVVGESRRNPCTHRRDLCAAGGHLRMVVRPLQEKEHAAS